MVHGPRLAAALLVLGTAVAATEEPATAVTNATAHRGRHGTRHTYRCPPGHPAGNVRGSDVYTDDSSICSAAVHAGRMTGAGGLVTIEIRPGRDSYAGSARRWTTPWPEARLEITSSDHGPSPGSFVFVDAQAGTDDPKAVPLDWSASAAGLRWLTGTRVVYSCPPAGELGRVWGTNFYTDDSSICTAAVNAGAITLAGGTFTVEATPGRSSYVGSTRYGVTTQPDGPWPGSFRILVAPAAVRGNAAVAAEWQWNALSHRGARGPIVFTCPAGGVPGGVVWGTDIYTDDSSVCTAAVHAGLIEPLKGGTVAIEMRPACASYAGTERHGVRTLPYAVWPGSFVFVPTPAGSQAGPRAEGDPGRGAPQ
jgi:hypothetical protein